MNLLPDSIPARAVGAGASGSLRIGQLVRRSFTTMTARERARLIAMYGVIAGLHVAGFAILFVFVVPSHYQGCLLPHEIHGLSRTTGFWGWMSRFNVNTAGFVIVGLFLATWLAALLIWRYARIEEKWNPALSPAHPAAPRD